MSENYVGGRTESGVRSHQNVAITEVDRVTKEKEGLQKEELQNEELQLAKAAGFFLEECRMVLSGIQALFGFQLITIFNSGFLNCFPRLSEHSTCSLYPSRVVTEQAKPFAARKYRLRVAATGDVWRSRTLPGRGVCAFVQTPVLRSGIIKTLMPGLKIF
jgi:hypothetical protein